MCFPCKLIWKCLFSNTGRMCCFKRQKAEYSTGHKKTGEFFNLNSFEYLIFNDFVLLLLFSFVSSQSIASGPVFYPATPPTHLSNMPIDQFAAVYPQGESFCFQYIFFLISHCLENIFFVYLENLFVLRRWQLDLLKFERFKNVRSLTFWVSFLWVPQNDEHAFFTAGF